MKKLFAFTLTALIIAVGFAIFNPVSGYTAPKESEMRVWVEFQPGKKSVTQAVLTGAGAQFHYTFDELNSFVVSLPAASLKGISRNPNVVSIEEDVLRYPASTMGADVGAWVAAIEEQTIPYGINAVQAPQVWNAGYFGDGKLVCIIDSGMYTSHEDLEGADYTGGIANDGDDPQSDMCGHGTHVAGTIAAQDNNVGVVGVAPGVSLFIVKVFGDDCSWTYSSTLVDAANKCADAGVDVISMSLSGSRNRKEEMAFDNLYSNGILSIAAASNDSSTKLMYPASYDSVISIAAVDSENDHAEFSNYNAQVELAAPGVGVNSTVPYRDVSSITAGGLTYNGHHIDLSARAEVGIDGILVDGGYCGSSGDWTNQIVLCERGPFDDAFTFLEKVSNVESGGGVAAVVYNSDGYEPGDFFGTLSTGTSDIPAITIHEDYGQALLDLVDDGVPEEGSVYSQLFWPESNYELYDGTSMATPHVSAVAALIWSAFPDKTNAEIREAMTSTALDLGVSGRDVYFGYGLVQAYDAYVSLGGGSYNEAPTVQILTPDDGATFDYGEKITFEGTAFDDEDENLNAALVWASSIDGEIGTGAQVDTTSLSVGDHTITASATDSGGKTGSASINITVNNPQDPGLMSVSSIDMHYSRRGRNYTIYTTVRIVDGDGTPIPGAAVEISTGLLNGEPLPYNAVTGGDGIATFSFSTRTAGTYTSTVVEVEHTNFTWDEISQEFTLDVP